MVATVYGRFQYAVDTIAGLAVAGMVVGGYRVLEGRGPSSTLMDEGRSIRRGRQPWKLGFTLALTTAACWGALPIALTLALQGMDPVTITWYRFTVAALVLGTILAVTGGLPTLHSLGRRIWLLLAIALAGLTGNYVLYLVALSHTTPSVAQIVIQLAPMFFLLGGLIVFRERFSARQWAGFALLMLGLALFFNRRLPELVNLSTDTGLGVALLVLAAIVWAAYGLAQKQLTAHFRPQQILWLVYLGAALVLFPAASLGEVRDLNALQLWMLIFCCANTLIAYGAFAEALKCWEAARIGAVLTLAPLFTLTCVRLAERFVPGLLAPEGLNALNTFGALLVVGGSAVCALSAANAQSLANTSDVTPPQASVQ